VYPHIVRLRRQREGGSDKYDQRLVCYQTWIEHKGVWVSTVAWDIPIGVGRCAETGVFREMR